MYNYVDTPDLTMNELVSQVRAQLINKRGVGLRLPYWIGMFLGLAADAISVLTRKNLPISSIRVKKFTSSTEFKSAKGNLDKFVAPFQLSDGVQSTLQSEFISPDPNREIFFTE